MMHFRLISHRALPATELCLPPSFACHRALPATELYLPPSFACHRALPATELWRATKRGYRIDRRTGDIGPQFFDSMRAPLLHNDDLDGQTSSFQTKSDCHYLCLLIVSCWQLVENRSANSHQNAN